MEVFFSSSCVVYCTMKSSSVLHYCPILLFYLFIFSPFFGAIALANCLGQSSSQTVNWDITLSHMQSGVKGWRLMSRVKGRNRTQDVCCFPRPFPLSLSLLALLSVFFTSPTFTLLIPLMPSLSFICCMFGNLKALSPAFTFVFPSLSSFHLPLSLSLSLFLCPP